jgi:hypothetical protein
VSEAVEQRVRRLLGGPEYRKLVAAARARLEEVGEEARSFTLGGLDEPERAALAGLLGVAQIPSGSVRVLLADLDAAISGSAAGVSLREALVILAGPIRDRRAERTQAAVAVHGRWEAARKRLEAAGRQELLHCLLRSAR